MHAACDPGIRDRRKWRPKEEMGGNGRKWEEMGGNGRAREGERERGREKSVAFVCKMIYKNHRNARSVYIASQKAWFTAFIVIIKKVEHMLSEEIILNQVRIRGSPPIKGTLQGAMRILRAMLGDQIVLAKVA